MRLRVLLIGLAVLLYRSPSWAHSAPFSYLNLNIHTDHVTGSLVVHNFDAAHELGIEPPERLLDPATAESAREQLVAVLAPRFAIRAERLLPLEWQGVEVLPQQNGLRLRFRIAVARPGTISLKMRLFPYDPVHQTFVNIYEDTEVRQQMVFAGNAPERVYYAGTPQGVVAVLRTFVPSGVHHILIGPDHILFLVGLLLLGGVWTRLVRIVTAFTLGHSLTLSLAALDILNPPARLIEPAIALSIVFVGADNLVKGMGRDVRTWVALVFGLVHGFGFAYVLREFGLPTEALGWSLFSFNLGVEIGQLLIVLIVATALTSVRRRSDVMGHRVAWTGSVLVIVAGAYWFVQRILFPGRA